MRWNERRHLGALAILYLSILPNRGVPFAQTNASSTPSTSSTGQQVSAIVRDAISSAFPGVSGIGGLIDAIWNHKPNNGDRVTKLQLQAATTNAREHIEKQIIAQAQQKLAPLTRVADELQVMSVLGVPTTTASQDIIKMSDRIKSKKTLSDYDWTQERADWEEAKAELATVKNADLSKIGDLWLRDKLTEIQQANVTYVARIDAEPQAKPPNAERVTDQLDKLFPTLQDISAAVGYEVSNMQAGIKSLSDWAKGAAGAEQGLSSQENVPGRCGLIALAEWAETRVPCATISTPCLPHTLLHCRRCPFSSSDCKEPAGPRR